MGRREMVKMALEGEPLTDLGPERVKEKGPRRGVLVSKESLGKGGVLEEVVVGRMVTG